MQPLTLSRIEARFGDHPPRRLIVSLGRHRAFNGVNKAELARAEWLWRKRPDSRLYAWLDRHAFLGFSAFTLLLLPLAFLVPVMVWAALYALYPVYLIRRGRALERWRYSYTLALWRLARSRE